MSHVEHSTEHLFAEHLFAEVVRDFQLTTPNIFLFVYYPTGTICISIHKDDEPLHACHQVINLCHGAGYTRVSGKNVSVRVVKMCVFYVF